MVAVITIVVQRADVAAENGFVPGNIVRIGIRRPEAGVAALQRNAIDQLKGDGAVSSRGGFINYIMVRIL